MNPGGRSKRVFSGTVVVVAVVVFVARMFETKVLSLFLLIIRYPASLYLSAGNANCRPDSKNNNNNINNNFEPHPSIMSNKKAAQFEFEVRPCALFLFLFLFLSNYAA